VAQLIPHAPQFWADALGSMQLLPHKSWFAGHTHVPVLQLPPMQLARHALALVH
jgi:hypothetical protein